MTKTNGLTVAITSFRRAGHLRRAIISAFEAGVSRVSVTSMDPTPEVLGVASEFSGNPGFSFHPIGADLGCNELWLQTAYRVSDSRLLLLHDDDYLDPEFGEVYKSTISPNMDKRIVTTWRGQVRWENGKTYSADYWKGPSDRISPLRFQQYLLGLGKLSLSPIITVFDRNTLIWALKECRARLTHPDCLLHPGMLLGTEIIAHLRNSQWGTGGWHYLDKVLSYYGAHEGSGTVKAEQSGDLSELVRGYDFSRRYFLSHGRQRQESASKILFVYSDYAPNDPETLRRHAYAKKTWDFHFDQGEVIALPTTKSSFSRTSADMGDPVGLPFVKDLVNHGMERARPEDIVVVANRDICLTTTFVEALRAGVKRGNGGVCVAARRSYPHPDERRLYRSVNGCKPDGGFDLFAFTPAWWNRFHSHLPDMVLGREAWDTCWRTLAEETSGGEAVYLDDVTYHEPHESPWKAVRTTSPSQVHNRKLCLEFYQKRPRDPRAHHFAREFAAGR